MGKTWKYNPFYWIAKRKIRFAHEQQNFAFSLHGVNSTYTSRQATSRKFELKYLNPFLWEKRAIRVFFVGFFTIMLPVYIFIGMQPVASINTEDLPTLSIPSSSLDTPVSQVELVNRELVAPANIAGSYSNTENKVFIIGHSSTVFRNLEKIELNNILTYNDEKYQVTAVQILPKSSISMSEILSSSEIPTIIIMTCAGENLPNQDATHRLIVTAEIIDN